MLKTTLNSILEELGTLPPLKLWTVYPGENDTFQAAAVAHWNGRTEDKFYDLGKTNFTRVEMTNSFAGTLPLSELKLAEERVLDDSGAVLSVTTGEM